MPAHKLTLISRIIRLDVAFIAIILSLSIPGSLQPPAAGQTVSPRVPFKIVVLPDTQHYALDYPWLLKLQTDWIAQNANAQNIVFVSQTGDIVENWDNQRQWQAADRAFASLDGHIPYGMAPGNHDIVPEGTAPYFNQYFPLPRLLANPAPAPLNQPLLTGAGSFGPNNTYHLFTAAGKQFIAINYEFCPTDDTVQWLDDTLSKFANYGAIITTHSFTSANGDRERAGHSCLFWRGPGQNAAVDIWDRVIASGRHNNVLMFLSGHDIWSTAGAARRTDMVAGYPVHQMLSNYQEFKQGGEGYLRILEFDTDKSLLNVSTYSPLTKAFKTDDANQFSLYLPLGSRFTIGSK